MGSPGRVFSRDELLNQVWGYDYYGDTRTVDSAVKRLRARLREVASDAELIVTVRDAGYKLSDDDLTGLETCQVWSCQCLTA